MLHHLVERKQHYISLMTGLWHSLWQATEPRTTFIFKVRTKQQSLTSYTNVWAEARVIILPHTWPPCYHLSKFPYLSHVIIIELYPWPVSKLHELIALIGRKSNRPLAHMIFYSNSYSPYDIYVQLLCSGFIRGGLFWMKWRL